MKQPTVRTSILTGLLAVTIACLNTPCAAQSWIQLAPVGTPPPNIFLGVFDAATDRMVVLGGDQPHIVWVLSNANGLGGTPQWLPFSTVADPAQGFPPSKGPSAVYDATNNRMITFGGCLANLWVANRGCLGADQRERTRRKPDLVEALAGRSTAITEG